jgi:hypothetical protein
MTNDAQASAHGAARAMLEAFSSVGAKTFDLTITDLEGVKVRFRRGVPLGQLRHTMPVELGAAAKRQHNVILRPRASAVVFIQLDDLNAEAMRRACPVSFLALETSPGNYQAWIATPEAPEGLIRQLRQAAGADLSASGATRTAGSLNFKNKYAPRFPRVEIAHTAPGLVARKEGLARVFPGVEPDLYRSPTPRSQVTPAFRRPGPLRWPNYRRCLEGAPAARDQRRPDVSRADFTWCMIAIDWGWSIEQTAARLMEESAKARENGERYALLTSQRAAAALDRRNTKAPRPCFKGQ